MASDDSPRTELWTSRVCSRPCYAVAHGLIPNDIGSIDVIDTTLGGPDR